MMKNKYGNIIPHKLTLWLEQEKLRFKAAEKEINKEFLSVLKSSKSDMLSLFKLNNCAKIDILPLAQNQKALWFLNQINSSSASYNVGIACSIYNELDKNTFEQAVTELIQKYWPLRTSIRELSGEKEVVQCQIVPDRVTPDITFQNISGSDDEIRQLLQEENNLPFDLSNGPLFRTRYYENNEGRKFILFSFHHIICDAISLQLFVSDFIKFVDEDKAGQTEETIASFPDHIYKQYQFIQNQGAEQLNFWKSTLKGVSRNLELPADFERPAIHNFNGGTKYFVLPKEEGAGLRNLAGRNNITLNVLLFTAFEVMLAEISQQKSFCIGMPASARTNIDYQKTFGYLINILPVPCKLSADNNFVDLIKNNSENIYSCLENQDIPFPVIVDEISGKRDLSSTPIFQVIFNYLNKKALGQLSNFLDFNQDVREWGTLQVSPLKLVDQEGQFDLTLEIFDNDAELYCSLKYNADIFKASTVESFIESFTKVLKTITSTEDYKFSLSEEKSKNEKAEFPINLTGSFTVEPIEKPLEFWFDKMRVKPHIEFLGYNQVFQKLLDVSSEFYAQPGSNNLILIRVEDYLKIDEATNHLNELKEAINAYGGQNTANKLIVVFCPVSDRLINNEQFIQESNNFEEEIIALSNATTNIQVIPSNDFITKYSLNNYYEPIGEKEGNIPYKENFYITAATLIARKTHLQSTTPFKAIVVDCDNTIWTGVVGEDGPLGVTIGSQEKALQQFLIEMQKAGVLICLCSKNNENDVWEVFEQNENMLLGKEHIAFHKINWQPKSKNIIELSKEINIGQDSFVFIDDNPIECEEVKANVPAVLTILKQQGRDDIDYLKNAWAFDQNKITQEDKKRASMYKLEAQRTQLKTKVKTYKEFIETLGVNIEINLLTDKELPRISQLTYRTNQFNFTTIRRTEEEIQELVNRSGYEVYYAQLTDKFGDYGIIGAFILSSENDNLEVDTFLMSCRALGKGVEHKMISFIGDLASKKSKTHIHLNFKKTAKNVVAERFLNANFNACLVENGSYLLPTEMARLFTFNPDELGEQEKQDSDAQAIKINDDILTRNEFFNDIIENLSSLKAITTHIYPEKENRLVGKLDGKNGVGSLEDNLLVIWKEVLDNDKIRVSDNFFDVGGQSILIPKVVARLHNELNITIKVVDLFQYPTIQMLAGYLSPKEKQKQPEQKVITDSKRDKIRNQRERFKKIRKI